MVSGRAVSISTPLNLIVMVMCLLCGIVIYAVNWGCDPVQAKKIDKIDQIMPLFVIEKMRDIPGTVGLFTACILSAFLRSQFYHFLK